MSLKEKSYWPNLKNKECDQQTKYKAEAIIAQSLGDTPLRVCSGQPYDPKEVIEMLDKRYASSRSTTRISVLTSLYSKRYVSQENMSKYIDEFESLLF